jgi:transcription factor C subunit 6
MTTLGIEDEHSVGVTSFTWVNTNRIACGHSDGSITLWSLHPRALLTRQLVHHTTIIEMASAYPSNPYHIMSNPVGGNTTITDLSAPSYETASYTSMVVNHQANLLQWNDHLQGWFSMYPSSNPMKTHVAYIGIRAFPAPWTIFIGERTVTCLAGGHRHPFLLIGCSDGAVWAVNPIKRLMIMKGEVTFRLKLFHHEFQPAERFPKTNNSYKNRFPPQKLRGAARILQGWTVEPNCHERTEARRKEKKRKKAKTEEDMLDEYQLEDEEGGLQRRYLNPERGIIDEPLTRITVMAWNPNDEFSCWAAAAMGSGLVRVMDLGVES